MNYSVHCRYRRFPDHHEYVEDLFCHSDDVEDIDISPYDECILITICRMSEAWTFKPQYQHTISPH